jgi:hypothetical protein
MRETEIHWVRDGVSVVPAQKRSFMPLDPSRRIQEAISFTFASFSTFAFAVG